MTISEVRNLFSHLETDQIYFNHAAIGPWCKLVTDRIEEYTRQRSGTNIENFSEFLKWYAGAKEKLGKLLNVPSHRLAWIDNVSGGISILAQGLKWKPGDRILLNNLEFPSNVYPFLNLKKFGVKIDFVKSKNGRIEFDDIAKAITPKTKLLSISLVQFLSGFRSDIESIGELCYLRDIIFCVDVIQAAGVVEIDAVKSKIGFLTGGTHKWLMCAQGCSYLYVTEELQSKISVNKLGWTSVKNSWNLLEYKLDLRDSAERFQSGGINALGISIFDSVLDLFMSFGMQNVENRIIDNTNYFIEKLSEIGINPILKNVDEKNRAGIVTFKIDNAQAIFDNLSKEQIYCAVREGMIRLSPHFYNTRDEMDKVVEVLKNLKEK